MLQLLEQLSAHRRGNVPRSTEAEASNQRDLIVRTAPEGEYCYTAVTIRELGYRATSTLEPQFELSRGTLWRAMRCFVFKEMA
jgi:hypothetical protein